MSRRIMCVVVSSAVMCLLVAGCSGGSDRPAVAQVRGVVTCKGQPVPEASVKFIPQEKSDATGGGRAASGETAADGTFVLSTFEEGDGAVPGKHTVLVAEIDPAKPLPGALPKDYTLEVKDGANQFEIELTPK